MSTRPGEETIRDHENFAPITKLVDLHDIDEPFVLGDDDFEPVIEVVRSAPPPPLSRPISAPPASIVHTPTGDEIVAHGTLDEETKVYNSVELAALLQDANPFKHATVPSFHAVKDVG